MEAWEYKNRVTGTMPAKPETNLQKSVGALRKILEISKRIVFFTGAGISTASGIPDFRSGDGLCARGDSGLTDIIQHDNVRRRDRRRQNILQNDRQDQPYCGLIEAFFVHRIIVSLDNERYLASRRSRGSGVRQPAPRRGRGC